MRWVLLWVVLVLGAAGLLFLVGRNLWRKAKALTQEMTQASDRYTAVLASLAELKQQGAGRADEHWSDEQWAPEPPAGGRRRRPPR